ncbi:MAG: RluA family pseudouridine synthase [Anaerolineaceae bacterium]|nr:RluA family pseudouridine synthase [Anaerolineaceae bacterium]
MCTPTIHILAFLSSSPERLDKFLSAQFLGKSRSQIQRLIKEGNVLVDDVIIKKTGHQLNRIGTSIEITIPDPIPLDLQPEHILLDIIYEDEDVLVINKPAGMVMHPSIGHMKGTLVHAALGHTTFSEGIGGKMRPGIVHRLDKNTSGVVILAKNEASHVWLQKQFKTRKVKKFYLALVDKHPPTETGKIIAPIYRDRANRKKMAVAPKGEGKEAVTIYRTLLKLGKFSFLEIQLLTGRTHQIRVHLSSIGSPVTGDTVYGYSTPTIVMDRHFLHAKRLEVRLPGQKIPHSFEAGLPADLQKIIDDLKKKEK